MTQKAIWAASEQSSFGVSARLLRALAARARLLIALLGLMAGLAVARGPLHAVHSASPERSLALFLHRKELDVDPAQVVWLASEPNLFGLRPALFPARAGKDLHDVYFANVRVSGNAVVDVFELTNTTRTSSADEDQIITAGPFVLYAARVGASYDALIVLDTRGEPAALTRNWPFYAKLQNAITNFQETGRMRAFGVRRYNFVDATTELRLSREDNQIIVVDAGARRIKLDPRRDLPLAGAEAIEFERVEKGQPGLLTWVVDTVRRVPWIGRGPVEWLEHQVFGLTDSANRAYHKVVVTDTVAEVQQALQITELPAHEEPSPVVTTTHALDIGWPPPPLKTVLEHRVKGEGVWLPIKDDPFSTQGQSDTALFYRTFIRVDPERAFTRVYVTLWDPRQVQLGVVMGTEEPKSATGETGAGQIPRDPWLLSHLVGAFNGGFQALHGEFGAMADGRVYLPPKPYAATVAVYDDGRVGMGSWPGPGRRTWDEELANSQIPDDMIAMRQNLTSVVEGNRYNPWQRWWWGAAPEWAAEQTYIPRSGLCLTSEGFLAYFWGESMGPEELGKAMLATRCARGMHLDMNGKHTGFELYRAFAPGAALPPLTRALSPSEYEGAGEDMLGFRFRARLALTTMTPQRFPRYLGRDPRDYFYLFRRALLPGAELSVGGSKVAFSSDGLPEAGFPYAFARSRLPDSSGAWVVRIDASRAVPRPCASPSLTRTLAVLGTAMPLARSGSDGQTIALYASRAHGRLMLAVGSPPAAAATLWTGPALTDSSTAAAALGVDAEGFLVYAETSSPSPEAGALARALRYAGVAQALALPTARLAFNTEAGQRAVDGTHPIAVDEGAGLSFMAEDRQAAEVMFPNVKPKPYGYWGWLQDQRVRYFPTGPARFPAPEWVKGDTSPDSTNVQPGAAHPAVASPSVR